jgi:hypothetical protein
MLAGHHTVENLFLDLAGPRDHCYTHAYGYVKGVVDARDEVQFSLPDSGYNWFNLMQDFKVWYILEGEDHKYHLAAHGLTRALAQKFPIKEKDASTQSQEPSED